MIKKYDVIIVGAGHAGCEAASVAAIMGSKVCLITMDMTKMGKMSCNPAMGGIAKGQIVREIDALGGFSGLITDRSTIQFKMLNKSKGPAMWSPRAQCDRTQFSNEWRLALEQLENCDFIQDTVVELIINKDSVEGVVTEIGMKILGHTVILTNGTFLNGIMHIGQSKMEGGRLAEKAAYKISDQLKDLGFRVGRMKTGTPVRIDGRTINFDKLTEQDSDEFGGFSFLYPPFRINKKRSCYIAYTNLQVHQMLQAGFVHSPLLSGTIKGIGPRYCPSIEDKIVTFSDKNYHQLFLEPEGDNTIEYYLNGFSSSLPWNVQLKALRFIEGFENARIFCPGYAIEYDYFDPTQLKYTLETKIIKNLFFAGQINGTTGYEEAAGQGLVAAINAHNVCYGHDEFVLKRDESYIGVLIDDLVNKGVDEPYRMFTSRAEFRILLRQDNADERLTPLGYRIGLASEERMKILATKLEVKLRIKNYCNHNSIEPDSVNGYLSEIGSASLKQKVPLANIVSRPEVKLKDLIEVGKLKDILFERETNFERVIIEAAEIEMKYAGYIDREKELANKIKRLEHILIKKDIDYDKLKSISYEGRQKLKSMKPKTIGQASRIPGVSPADINVLLVFLNR
jgi:tRNA uridine 5-carboxymethylaminomethyl modification enzyme